MLWRNSLVGLDCSRESRYGNQVPIESYAKAIKSHQSCFKAIKSQRELRQINQVPPASYTKAIKSHKRVTPKQSSHTSELTPKQSSPTRVSYAAPKQSSPTRELRQINQVPQPESYAKSIKSHKRVMPKQSILTSEFTKQSSLTSSYAKAIKSHQ